MYFELSWGVRQKSSFPSFILSLLVHIGVAMAVSNVPTPTNMVPEGTMELVEFSTLPTPAPKGEQIKSQDVSKVEEDVPSLPIVKPVKSEESPKPIVAKNELPPKKAEKAPEKPAPTSEKLPATSIADEQSKVFADIPKENMEPESTENFAKEDMIEDTTGIEKELEQDLEDESANEESLGVAAVSDELKQEIAKDLETIEQKTEPSKPQEETLVSGPITEEPKELSSQSNLNYGVPSGAVRDYKDLRQHPGNRPPQYPTNSRRNLEQGQVQLMYYVTPEGRVTNVKMIKSSGFAALDQEALDAISKFRYFPGQQGFTKHSVNFVLRGKATPDGGRLRTSRYSR